VELSLDEKDRVQRLRLKETRIFPSWSERRMSFHPSMTFRSRRMTHGMVPTGRSSSLRVGLQAQSRGSAWRCIHMPLGRPCMGGTRYGWVSHPRRKPRQRKRSHSSWR
jgi:hypothetical protein